MSDNLFDVQTDFVLSQLDLDTFLQDEEKRGHFPYSQGDLDQLDFDSSNTKDMPCMPSQLMTQQRFQRPLSSEEVDEIRNQSFSANTVRNTNWAVNAYDSWGKWRNDYVRTYGQLHSERFSLVPPLTAELTAEEVDFWLCKFVVEVKRKDGTAYPPPTIKQLCIGIWRFLRDTCVRYDLNPFNKENPKFSKFQHTLDGKMKISECENPHVRKQAEPVSNSEEDMLWINVFNRYEKDSRSLSHCVYFYNCKVFALRAADEHANLMVDQFTFGESEFGKYINFQGGTAKNCQGGIYHKSSEKKSIKQYEQPDNPRCVVKLFRYYLSIIPPSGRFYRRPLAGLTSGIPKFSQQKVGRHTLQGYMPNMCQETNIKGRKTGHSGKVTTATCLYQNNFDEQLIKERTGHRSDAVRAYKRTSEEQVKAVSNALQPPNPKSENKDGLATQSENVESAVVQRQGECRVKVTKGDLSLDFQIL